MGGTVVLVDIPRLDVMSADDLAAAVEAAVKARLVETYTALVDATDIAAQTLINIALYGRREDARVAAAKEILDRAGLSAEIRVSVDTQESDAETRMAAFRAKLDSMRTSILTPLELDEGTPEAESA